ncbi:hypothetical protein ACFLSY_05560 [Bacteroidota bacterium]
MNEYRKPEDLFGNWTDEKNNKVISISRGNDQGSIMINVESSEEINKENNLYDPEVFIDRLTDKIVCLTWESVRYDLQLVGNNLLLSYFNTGEEAYDFSRNSE